jgi:HK97 family phage major capsid protein
MRDCALVDWAWLRANSRAMATTPGPKGGYAVGVDGLPAVDPLWQDSTIGVTGVEIIEGLANNAAIPRGTGAVSVSWQSGEGVAPSAVDETLGSISVTPKTVIATVQASVQLLRQSPALLDFLSRLLLRKVRSAFDNALLQGTGASGQPQGLANLATASGIQQVSGASLAWSGIENAQRLVSASGVPDSRVTWVGAPTVRETLGQRERVSTSGRFIWDDAGISGRPALSTPDAPAATLFVGDFSQAVLALFGPGIELRFDPHNNYAAGLCAFQVLAMADIVFPQPAAFARIVSIT